MTTRLDIDPDNVDEICNKIKNIIGSTPRALTVAIYNNKGGIGKTTTTINIAAALSLFKKKVLVVDFDPNQQDLSKILKIKPAQQPFCDYLQNYKKSKIENTISSYRLKFRNVEHPIGFDVIPADKGFLEISPIQLGRIINPGELHRFLSQIKNQYDYILIDTPPNFRFFSQSALYAADVVLIPTKHNDLASLENAAVTIKRYIPQIGDERRKKYKPEAANTTALPIFFNGGNLNDAAQNRANKAIKNIIDQAKQAKPGCDLLPYFYPKFTQATKNTDIFTLPNSAHIPNATFTHKPAVYTHINVRDFYKQLVAEYFLQ
ncbi:MAG: ParA family protein [Moorea sp. SIO2B7]|nr:ParA family protein [Moorena sp. SIO2B7]